MTTTTPVACPTCSAAVPAGRARCPVCQQAIARPASETAIAVHPDDDLATVLAQAPAGATVSLAPGEYRLIAELALDRPLTLQGAGWDATRIDSTALGSMLRYTGDGPLVLRGLHMRHMGETWAHGVVVSGGRLVMQGCRVEDGRPGEAFSDMGDGLRLGGSATATVSRCEFLGHGGDGIAVLGTAGATVEDTLCQGNRQSGIAFLEKSGGTARGNRCEGNGKNGLAVFAEAAPRLEANRLVGNGLAGLRYSDRAGGEAVANVAERNRNGAAIDDQAAPRLVENRLVGNTECGLLFAGETAAIATGNRCEANGWDGIFINASAAPTLTRNQVTDNRRNGLAYFDQARGRAAENRVVGNACDGITLFAAAAPQLEGNRVEGNGWNGIMYFDETQGAAVSNQCEGNQGSGIALTGRARPLVAANRLVRNGEFGLAFRAHAAGTADDNQCLENGLGAIHQDKTAKPTLNQGAAHPAPAAAPPPLPPPPIAAPPGDQTHWELTPKDDLAGAIALAAPGATITLAAGDYVLAARLDLDKPLRLVGAGRDATRIIGRSEGFVLRAYGRGGLVLEGVHVLHQGDAWAHGLMVDGPAEIRDCRFSGASRDPSSKLGGCGVWLCARATGEIRGCVFTGNVYGLAVQAVERFRVQENHCVDNEVGMAFLERTAAYAEQNHCEKNTTGMLVDAEAQPALEANRLSANRKHGLLYQGQAAGTARRNLIAHNGGDGVRVRDEARPELRDNMLTQNRGFGLCYAGTGAGSAYQNEIAGNQEGAIAVSPEAGPVLGGGQGEVARTEAAIKQPPTAKVVRIQPGDDLVQVLQLAATDTEIQLEPGTYPLKRTLMVRRSMTLRAVGSGAVRIVLTAQKAAIKVVDVPRFAMHGIWVERDTSHFGEVMVVGAGELTLQDCMFTGGRNHTNFGRGGDGLRIIGQTAGTVERCEFKHNQGFGIAVCDDAQPMLRANHVHHNHLGGIGYYQQAAGAAERNRCVNNQHSGIKLFDKAAPTLWSNELLSNARSGIAYMDASGGLASQNTCSTNHYYGIELMDFAWPRIEGNVLSHNLKDGFCCGSAEVRALVKGNLCEHNGGRGIYVAFQHRLRLEANVERDNRGEG